MKHKFYVHAVVTSYSDQVSIFVSDLDMESASDQFSTYVLIDEKEIDIEVPGRDFMVARQIELLEKGIEKERESFHKKLERYNDKISKLRALTYDGDNDEVVVKDDTNDEDGIPF